MLDNGHYLHSSISLGHFPRALRIELLQSLCVAARADVGKRGPDPRLMMLAVGLSYCASLLADAGDDPPGDAADAALARLDDELRALRGRLSAALSRSVGLSARRLAAELLAALQGAGRGRDLLEATQAVLDGWLKLDLAAQEGLACRHAFEQVAIALGEAEARLAACHGGAQSQPADLVLRARKATRFADELLRRALGHIAAITDPDDPIQSERAGELLSPIAQALAVLLPSGQASASSTEAKETLDTVMHRGGDRQPTREVA